MFMYCLSYNGYLIFLLSLFTGHLFSILQEFHLFFSSDHCFPPITEIPDFLTYQGRGPSVTIELPTNMHNDSGWAGLLICASFTFQENQIEFLENLESEIPHHLICFFDTDIDSLRPIHVYRTAKQEFKWLHLHGFIWLFYIPIWWLPDRIQCCNHIEVSIMSDWPGWIVNNCGLRFLSAQDSGDLMQLLLPFQVSFFDNWGLFHKEILEQDCTQPEPFSHQTEGCTSLDSATNQGYEWEKSTISLKRKLESLFSTLFELSRTSILHNSVCYWGSKTIIMDISFLKVKYHRGSVIEMMDPQ